MSSTFRLERIVLPVIVLIAAAGTGQEIWSLEDAGLTSEEFGSIVSLGADGLPQFDDDAFEPGAFPEDANPHSHPDDDIISANGTFVSYPESVPAY